MHEATVFRQLITECGTLESYNRFIVPLMKNETPELRHIAAEEAKRRGYKGNKITQKYE